MTPARERDTERLLRSILARVVLIDERLVRLEERREAAAATRAEPEPCLSVPKAAKRLGMDVKTLRRLIATGEVTALRAEGANVTRIAPAELARLTGAREVST